MEFEEPSNLSPIMEQVDSFYSDITLSPDANDNIRLAKKPQTNNIISLHLQEDNLNEDYEIKGDSNEVEPSETTSVLDSEESLIVDDILLDLPLNKHGNNKPITAAKSVDNIYKCVRVHPTETNLISEAHLLNQVQKLCRSLYEHFLERKFEHCIGEAVFLEALQVVEKELGFSLEKRASRIPNGGKGVFVRSGSIPTRNLVAFYPGTVYSPGDSVFVQSIANPFVFRCVDNVLIDGNDKYLSKLLYRSCSFRDRLGKYMCSDLTWLTDRPLNPLTVGQYVNNATKEHQANVMYQEANLPLSHFPIDYRRFLPNTWYNSTDGGHEHIRLVALVSTRNILAGEELYSNYFTVVGS